MRFIQWTRNSFNLSMKFMRVKARRYRLLAASLSIALCFSGAAYSLPDKDLLIDLNSVRIEEGKKVKVGEDQEVDENEYLIVCGQHCAFQAASEVMAATQVYFQHYKESTKGAATEARRKKVIACNEGDETACDEEVLDSMLHYMVGLEIRDNYLFNRTSGKNMDSTIEDYTWESASEGMEDQDSTGETRNQPWLTGEGGYADIPEDQRPYLPTAERDNFRFDLGALEAAQSEVEKLAELDADFVKQYRAFFDNYRKPEDRLFAKLRATGEGNDRAIAAEGQVKDTKKWVADYEWVDGEDGNKVLTAADFDEARRDSITQGFDRVRQRAQNALQVQRGPQALGGTLESITDRPRIFERGRDKTNNVRAQQGLDLIERGIAKGEVSPTTRLSDIKEAGVRAALEGFAVSLGTSAGKVDITVGDLQEAMKSQLKTNTPLPSSGAKEYQAALDNAADINKEISKFIDQEKARNEAATDGSTVDTTYTFDVAKFDEFLDQIWPTGEKKTL